MHQDRKEDIETSAAWNHGWTAWALFNALLFQDFTMNTARILSIASLAALASFGAQAGIDNSNAGDIYGYGFDAAAQSGPSTLNRDAVRSEGAAALPGQTNNTVFSVSTLSNVTRNAIRAQAVTAVHNGELATGNQS